jgi:hypothetical protein
LDNRDDYSKLIGEKTYLGELFNYKITNQSFFFSFRETGYNVVSKSYHSYYDLSVKKIGVYNNPFIRSMNYPVSTTLLYASDNILIYPMHPMVLSEDSFDIINKTLSDPVQFDSNPILIICELK